MKFSQSLFYSRMAFWVAVIGIIRQCVTGSLIAHKPLEQGRESLCVHPSVVVPRQITLAVATGEILIGLFCQRFLWDRLPVS